MSTSLRILVHGASGRMGRAVSDAIGRTSDLDLVARTGRVDDLESALRESRAQVMVDFSHPDLAADRAILALSAGAHVVMGTTGLSTAQKRSISMEADRHDRAILIASNFSVGAILMERFAAEAARILRHVEIVEYHHDRKADAPSGTALSTARRILDRVGETASPSRECIEQLDAGSRGAALGGIRIHSVRMPGFLAAQEVILGEEGQTLRIRHDVVDRSGYLPGVLLAVREIPFRKGLLEGLESILDLQGGPPTI